MSAQRLVEVALPIVLDRAYTYAVPSDWSEAPGAGARVLVPFGPRVLYGVVRPGTAHPPKVTCKPILAVIEDPSLPKELVQLCEWMSSYYLAPVGEAYRLVLPGLLLSSDARRFRLTKQGRALADCAKLGPLYQDRELLARHPRSEQELALLVRLEALGMAAPLSAVMAKLSSHAVSYAQIEDLAKQGDCELYWDQEDKGGQELHYRSEPLAASLTREGTEAEIAQRIGKSKRRRALLDDLVSQGVQAWIPASALRARFPRLKSLSEKLLEAGLISSALRPRQRDPFTQSTAPAPSTPPTLTPMQGKVLQQLSGALQEQRFASFLLFGVTGSGKTEIYLRLIGEALAAKGSAIVLVPEIALTPQLADRFRARFGEAVAVLHSALSDKERLMAFRMLRSGERRIAIGARSAIFAPLCDLRVVIVDEEHDPSFKQDEGLRYHGRDVALVRAKAANAVVVLGSATPSLESLMLARKGRHQMLELPERVTPKPLPPVEILSLTTHRPDPKTLLSAKLKAQVLQTVQAGEQAILFLNRRGFTTMLRCSACGESPSCPDCSSSTLTYHRQKNRWVCHLCGYMCDPSTSCPSCQAPELKHLQAGTERVQAAIEEDLAPVRVLRLDRDTSRGKKLLELLAAFRNREADVLVGTQMLAKGHDFPGVTLVGVLCADQGLSLPDPRASERVFSLLTQVSGRAGRGDRPGRVMIQAWAEDAHPLPFVLGHDYRGFSEQELTLRRDVGNPPWGHLALLRVHGLCDRKVMARIQALAALARSYCEREQGAKVTLLGPVASPQERINQRTRWQCLLRSLTREPLRELLVQLRPKLGIEGRAQEQTVATIDVDPHQFM